MIVHIHVDLLKLSMFPVRSSPACSRARVTCVPIKTRSATYRRDAADLDFIALAFGSSRREAVLFKYDIKVTENNLAL